MPPPLLCSVFACPDKAAVSLQEKVPTPLPTPDAVVLCVNNNSSYWKWCDVVTAAWLSLGITPHIFYISPTKPPDEVARNPHVIHVQYDGNVNTALLSQAGRLLFPALLRAHNNVLVADIDMVPLPRAKWYFDRAQGQDADALIVMRKKADQYMMAFNCASPATWAKTFGLTNLTFTGVIEKLEEWLSKIDYKLYGAGWGTDQDLLKRFASKNKTVVLPPVETYSLTSASDGTFKRRRIDRPSTFEIDRPSVAERQDVWYGSPNNDRNNSEFYIKIAWWLLEN